MPGHFRGNCLCGRESENDDRCRKHDERPQRDTGTGKKVRMATEKQRSGQEGWSTVGKGVGAGIYIKASHHVLSLRKGPTLAQSHGWIGDKPCLVTVDTGAYVIRQARHRRRMARKTAEPTLHTADGIWGSPPHFEVSFPDTDPGAAPTENLGIRRKYHKDDLGAGNLAVMQCVYGRRAPNAAPLRGRGIAMERRAPVFQPGSGQ
jgi:hypothetical protein